MSTLPTTPRDDYDSIDAMNGSTLVHGLKSMWALKRAIDAGFESTAAMEFGVQYHALILEPHEFKRSHAVMPNFAKDPKNVDSKGAPSTNANTTWCRRRKAQFYSDCEAEGVTIIEQKKFDAALEMVESIHRNELARKLIKDSQREVTVTGEISGVPMKGRVDLMRAGLIADIKGTQCAENLPFGRRMAQLHTFFKLAIHRELARQQGATIDHVYLIAVESSGYFETAVYEVPEAALDHGLDEVKLTLERYKRAKKANYWPGIQDGVSSAEPLHLPDWAMPEEDLEWGSAE